MKDKSGTRRTPAAALAARFRRAPRPAPEPGGLAFIAVALLAVAVVAAVAFSGSWQHQYELSIRLGQARWVAGMQPLSVEGLIAGATLVIWYAARYRHGRAPLAYLVLAVAVAQSVLMNLGADHPWPWLGTEISVWPAAAFFAGYEMAVWMVRKRAESFRPADRGLPEAPGRVTGNDVLPVPDREEPRRVRPSRAAKPPGPAVLSAGEAAWTAELTAAGLPLPPYRSWSHQKTGMYRQAGTRRAYDRAREELASMNGGSGHD